MADNIFVKNMSGDFTRKLPVSAVPPAPARTLETPTQYAYGRQPNDPLNKFNTATGALNPNYKPTVLTNSSPAPTVPETPTAPITDNPYDAFNMLLQDSLKKAQTLNTTDLLKQQRELQRQRIAKVQGTGGTQISDEERRFLSPEQQGSIRSSGIAPTETAIDEVQYNIAEINQLRKDLLEQISLAQKSGSDVQIREAEKAKLNFEQDLATKKFEAGKESENRKFNEDKRQFGLDYALKTKELNQKIAEKSTTATGDDSSALSSMNLINTLLQNPKLGAISGVIQGGLGLGTIDPRSDVQLARNQFQQIKGILALENRSKLKGSGAVSDFESKTLERAASSLDRNLGDEEFAKQLRQVKGSIATSHGLSADVLLINPTTKQSQIVLADSNGIAQAIKDGLTVEYQ